MALLKLLLSFDKALEQLNALSRHHTFPQLDAIVNFVSSQNNSFLCTYCSLVINREIVGINQINITPLQKSW